MSVELISQDFSDRFDELLYATQSKIRIISPFIGLTTANRLAEYLKNNRQVNCEIITRFYREDFIRRVSSIEGLNNLFQAGAEILALQKLHTKLYIFDSVSSIVGSANFTTGGFSTNHELSILLDDEETVAEECNTYFEELWNKIKETGDGEVTEKWLQDEMDYVRKLGKNIDKYSMANMKKRGANISFEPDEKDVPKVCYPVKNIDIIEENLTKKDIQSDSNVFLKFIGKSSNRRNGDERYITSKNKGNEKKIYFHIRPRAFKDNAVMYIVALSYDDKGRPSPMILGRAITYGFDIQNEATEEEKRQVYWKREYPYYIEFKHAEFIDTTINNTIPLDKLHEVIGFQTYPGTASNPKATRKDINRIYSQKSHVRITEIARKYLDGLLDEYFNKYGCIKI